MAEYINVERPFLDKLNELGWEIIDQGAGIPSDPSKSYRSSFKEVTLKEMFKATVKKINLHEGKEWLTDSQLDEVYAEVISAEKTNLALLEANQEVFAKLTGLTKITVRENELSGEQNPLVKIIDYDEWSNNSFIAINQFRVVTPGGPRQGIIPDIVLFVNGLPFSVIECKDVDVNDPLSEGVIQIQRYSNTRDDLFGVVEGEEKLFHYNLFSITTHGEEARFGTITGSF